MRHSFPPLWLCLVFLLASLFVRGQVVNIVKDEFISVYDVTTQVPRQVEWTLHAKDVGHAKRETQWRFTMDVPNVLAVSSHADYNRSGYHRGHMCPAADRSVSKQSMKSTFVMSNVAPQLPAINVGSWKQTENLCRTYALQYDSVCVLACPVFLHRDTLRIGHAPICVPHAYFKAVWVASTDSVLNAWFIFNK